MPWRILMAKRKELGDMDKLDIAGIAVVDEMPVLVADDDFIEYLHELGYEDEIEFEDLLIALDDWIEEVTS
jgi:hypothetical protein